MMKVLPNGVTVFNATPHAITFWREDWDAPVTVPTDEVINARPVEMLKSCLPLDAEYVWLVGTEFAGDDAGREIIARAKERGAEIIVGSIIAAQAYPGEVVAMVPAPGYERVPAPLPRDVVAALEEADRLIGGPSLVKEVLEKYRNLPTKRMCPDKFAIFKHKS